MKPRKSSFLHYQSWEYDLVCSSNSLGAGAVTHKSHRTQRGPLDDPGFAMKIHQGSSGQTSVQQSWGKPLQSFPVLVLSNDKCLFHVRIKQCRRQSHKQKLQWHWFCMLAESLLKRNSHTCQRVSPPENCDCGTHLAATYRPTGIHSSSLSDSGTLTLQLPDNCSNVFLAEPENFKRA